MNLLTLVLGAILTLGGSPASDAQEADSDRSGVIDACLLADLTRDDAPENLFALVRRFPTGQLTRDLAWHPEAPARPEEDAVIPPRLMLVYGIDGPKAGPLRQLSVTTLVVFRPDAPDSVQLVVLADGAEAFRQPWPEYARAVADFKRTGSPKYIGGEEWLIWDGRGQALRDRISTGAKTLEVRLEGPAGVSVAQAVYDISQAPLAPTPGLARLTEMAAESEDCG